MWLPLQIILSSNLKLAGVRRIAIGIGKGIGYGELKEIAGSDENVIQVHSYSDLISRLEKIMKMACDHQALGTFR